MIDMSDRVREISNVGAPDPRMAQQSLALRLFFISQFVLCEGVPVDVKVHFETGKNLFVYAWHVYRFHMVAEQHVLATLEMALRLRLIAITVGPPPLGLWKLLRSARDKKLISNARFANKYQWALEEARRRHDYAEIERMTKEGLDECVVDYTNVLPSEEDLQYDWLDHFIAKLPGVRNMHAHGSDVLYPGVVRTFEIVVDLINQLYTDEQGNSEGALARG